MINFVGETKKFKKTIQFYNEKMKNKDFSLLKFAQLYFGPYLYGVCHFPYTKRSHYVIKCRANEEKTNYPTIYTFNVRLNKTYNLIQKDAIYQTAEEAIVWLLGHELFHYLRATQQIKGKNTEAQANEFGFKCLSEFKNYY